MDHVSLDPVRSHSLGKELVKTLGGPDPPMDTQASPNQDRTEGNKTFLSHLYHNQHILLVFRPEGLLGERLSLKRKNEKPSL